MSILDGILLGIVQGITEFLPISSTGHLILFRDFFGISMEHNLAFDAALHLATLCAVGWYFFEDLIGVCRGAWRLLKRQASETERVLVLALLVGTVPGATLGFFLEGFIESNVRHAGFVAAGLLVGSILIYASERRISGEGALSVSRGWWIGWFQALALVPGISRSGATISGGMFFGLSRENAARFSFLLSFPILLGAGLSALFTLSQSPEGLGALGIPMVAGLVAAFISGIAAIHYLLQYIRTHSLRVFVWYRVLLAAVIILTILVR